MYKIPQAVVDVPHHKPAIDEAPLTNVGITDVELEWMDEDIGMLLSCHHPDVGAC